jgi:inner membrane protein
VQVWGVDSVTQAALGAAVAEATIGGRRLGNKAIFWGIALGSLPDLDILFYPFLEPMEQLRWHRGISHSLFFCIVAAPLFGWLICRIHKGKVRLLRASIAVFLIFFTHTLIDVFTVYGTMIWEPFSDMRVGTNNLFIIDPLFTLPLIAGLVAAFFLPRQDPRRMRWNALGLALASVYTLWSFGAKGIAHAEFARTVREHEIPAVRMMSSPTPFNTLTWRGLVETPDDFRVAYFSLLHPGRKPEFRSLPKNHHLIQGLQDVPYVEALRWFSNGFFGIEETDDGLVLSDWRFGEIPRQAGEELEAPRAIFAWTLQPVSATQEQSVAVERRPFDRRAAIRNLMRGPEPAIGAAPAP